MGLTFVLPSTETEWSSDNTEAYDTGDPGSIPGRGGSSEKCESV